MGRPALRVAMPDDAEALVGIYAHYVKRTASSFEWEPGRQAVFLGAEPFGRAHAAAWPALNDQILAL